MKNYSLLLVFSIMIQFISCKESKEGKKLSHTKIDSIAGRVNILEDSIATSWKTMSKNEDDMLFNIRRLLQEIEYIPGHEVKPLDTLNKAVEKAKSLRYNQISMEESARIDRYDEVVTTLVSNVTTYANSVKGIDKYQIAAPLLEEINQQFQKIYLNRVHYNFHVQDYNELILKNKKRLEKYNPKYAALKKMPVF